MIVISDCHLSAGRFYDGLLNPHEDFHFDDEMCAFFDYFSTGRYGDGPDGPVEVELFINGVSQGRVSNPGDMVFHFRDLALRSGTNTLKAVGSAGHNTTVDSVVWNAP